MSPSDFHLERRSGLLIPWPGRGYQAPSARMDLSCSHPILRCALLPSTPESPVAARGNAFTTGTGFDLSDSVATLGLRVTGLIWIRLSLRLAPSQPPNFMRRIAPPGMSAALPTSFPLGGSDTLQSDGLDELFMTYRICADQANPSTSICLQIPTIPSAAICVIRGDSAAFSFPR
jgi:hypothetical protein